MNGVSRRRLVVVLVIGAACLVVSACGASRRDVAGKHAAITRATRAVDGSRAAVHVGGDAAVAPTSTSEGFVGVATEISAITSLAGLAGDPDKALVPLLRNLSPGAPFSLRLGGQSTDGSWWPIRGMKGPRYAMTPRWGASVRALLTAVGGKAILGVDLRKNSPEIARAEVAGYDRYVGARRIDAFELGNEPEAYNLGVSGVFGHLHRLSFSRLFVRYGKRFGHVASALGEAPLAGPATGSPYWQPKLGTVLGALPLRHLKLATIHEYALKACSGETHLTVSDFFTHAAIAGMADTVHGAVQAAAQHGKPLRVAEINGDPCLGARGVSNSFGEALWALNMLPALWRAGVQGVNIQRGQSGPPPNYNYNKFITARRSSSGWRIAVEPEYYGLLAFADAAPAGSHLLRITNSGLAHFYQFAVRAPDKTEHVVLTNVGATAHTISVTASGTSGTGSVSLLTSHSLSATTGTTLAGQTLSSRTGQLSGPTHHTLLAPNATGTYTIRVPAHSAAILTLSA